MIPLGVLGSAVVVAAGGFSPDDLADLSMWLKADAITDLSDGDTVATWADSGPAGADAAAVTESEKPTYQAAEVNGLPCVRFDGTDRLWLGSVSSVGPVTLFAVIKQGAAGTIVGPNWAGGLQWRISTGLPQLLKAWTEGIVASSTPLSAGWHVLTATYSATTAAAMLRRDGAADASATYTGSLTAWETWVGCSNNGGERLSGDLAEVIRYSRVLDSGDITAVEAYLANKYGL